MIDLATPSDLAGLAIAAAAAAGQSQLFLALLAALQSTFAATPQHLSLLGKERDVQKNSIISWHSCADT